MFKKYTHVAGSSYDYSMISVETEDQGFIGGVLIGLGGEIKWIAPSIGWNEEDVLRYLPKVAQVVV